jgi:hypothetical protein
MPSVVELLDRIDLGRLSVQLSAARGTVGATGTLQADPAALLGDLGEVIRSVDLPRNPQELVGALRAALGELQGLVRIPHLDAGAEVAVEIERLLAVVSRIVEDVAGDVDSLLETLTEEAGSLTGLVREAVDRITGTLPLEIPELARGPLLALQALAAGRPREPRELATALSRIVAGVDLDSLARPAAVLEAFLDRVRAAGGSFADVDTQLAQLTTQTRALTARLGQPGVDARAVVSAAGEIRVGLDLLVTLVVPGAMGRLTRDLAALDPGVLQTELGQRLRALVGSLPSAPFDLVDTIESGLGEALGVIEATSEEDLKARIKALEARMRASFEDSGLADALGGIDGLFDAIIEQMQRVPARRLRTQLVDAIGGVEAKVRAFPGFTGPERLAEQVARLDAAIDGIDLAAVQQRVQGLTRRIADAAGQFPIAEIEQEVRAVVADVAAAVEQFGPALDGVKAQLDALAARIAAVDISGAGDAALALMKEIRTNVEAVVGSGDLPEPARVAIGAAAGTLGEVKISVEVRAPFDAALSAIDPSALLDPMKPVVARVRSVLETVTPGALVAQLDGPFQAFLGELERLRPSALVAALSSEFARLLDALQAADPRQLVAPLEAEFQKALATLRAALDPGVLFAPLRAAYATLRELLDRLQFRALFQALSGRLAGLPASVRDAVQASTAAVGTTGIAAPAPTVDLPAIKVGDLLRPLAVIVAQLRKLVLDLTDDLVAGAVALLDAPLRAIRELADPALGLIGVVAREVDARVRALDLFATSGPAAELREALEDLRAAGASASFSAEGSAEVGPALAALRLEARMDVLGPAAAALDVQQARLTAGGPDLDLQAAVERLGEMLDSVFPDPRAADPAAGARAMLAALFERLDPAPLADRLDELGARAIAKLEALSGVLARAVFELIGAGFALLDGFTPVGLLRRLDANLDRVKAELGVLDPAPIEAEVRSLVDAVLEGLSAYSPAALAGQLGGLFDSARQKVAALDPAVLLGDLSAIDAVIDRFAQLRPSVVLAPLAGSTKGLEATLEKILAFQLGDAVVQVVERLRAEVDEIVAALEAELQALIRFLQGLAGGDGRVQGAVSLG